VIAAVFPGQGCEEPGVGVEWASHPLFDVVSGLTGVDARRAVERFTRDLARTSVLQPVLVALSLVAWARLRARGVHPAWVAGHSIGEIAAWAASGAIDDREAIVLAATRGLAMEQAASERPGAMIALGPSHDRDRAVSVGRAHGEVSVAATNGPSQTVLSGDLAAVAAIEAAIGGRRVRVSGAWHTPMMASARGPLAAAVARVAPRRAERTLVTSIDGRALAPEEVPDLAGQLDAPVAWDRVMGTLRLAGVTDVVWLAPGRVMRALLRDGLGDLVRLHVADSEKDLDRIAQSLVSQRAAS